MINLLFRLFYLIPPNVLRCIFMVITLLAHAIGIRRSVARRNMALAFPNMPEKKRNDLVRCNYLHLGECAADFLRSPKMTDQELFSMVDETDYQKVKDLVDKKIGFIVPTAHFGNFELFGVWAGRRGVPITILTKVLKGSANAAWVKTREMAGVREIHKGWQNLFDAVRNGDTLALLIDQNMIRRRSIFVPFFGIQTSTTPAPAKVALETGAPIYLSFLKKESTGKYRLIIDGPIPFQRTKDGDLQKDISDFTARLNDRLEKQIRQSPEQWFWVHRRFKTRPNEGDPSLY